MVSLLLERWFGIDYQNRPEPPSGRVDTDETRLNLGCGQRYIRGYTNVDHGPPADLLMDLNDHPWPFPDEYADEIYMSHVLEHLRDPMAVMLDVWRVLKPGAKAIVIVPHHRHPSAYHIGHLTYWNEISLRQITEPRDARNEGGHLFDLLRTHVDHDARYPFHWHLEHHFGYHLRKYLHLPIHVMNRRLPLGPATQITFVLRARK